MLIKSVPSKHTQLEGRNLYALLGPAVKTLQLPAATPSF